MREIWPSSGFRELRRDGRGWLVPTDAWWRRLLARPELALVEASCAAERRLHASLHDAPARPVEPGEPAALEDADARDNYRHFLRFRDALLAAGTLEAWYLDVFRRGRLDLPPLFVDLVAAAVVRNVVDGIDDALTLRAAELLFRTQRVAVHDGRVLAADRDALDRVAPSAATAVDVLALLRAEPSTPATTELEVLGEANAARYLADTDRHAFALDLSHAFASDLGHGLVITLAHADSGLKALGRVLAQWIAHFLGIAVRIEPRSRIDDPAWSWHVGLDVESTALLNALYRGRGADDGEGANRLIGLFRLDFVDPSDMRADLAGKPVYLGLAMTPQGILKLKPQNLLVNLPLARST
jgi:hypothetical protein